MEFGGLGFLKVYWKSTFLRMSQLVWGVLKEKVEVSREEGPCDENRATKIKCPEL